MEEEEEKLIHLEMEEVEEEEEKIIHLEMVEVEEEEGGEEKLIH